MKTTHAYTHTLKNPINIKLISRNLA